MKLPYSIARTLAIRKGWYLLRKSEGHPISLLRAYLGKVPRFSAYEPEEPGCPEWAKRDYKIVKKD